MSLAIMQSRLPSSSQRCLASSTCSISKRRCNRSRRHRHLDNFADSIDLRVFGRLIAGSVLRRVQKRASLAAPSKEFMIDRLHSRIF